MSPLLHAKPEMLESAEAATRLTTATIFATGGFHLLMGEGDGALDDPSCPRYATLRPEFASITRVWPRSVHILVRFVRICLFVPFEMNRDQT